MCDIVLSLRLRLEHAWICALYKFCNNNNNCTRHQHKQFCKRNISERFVLFVSVSNFHSTVSLCWVCGFLAGWPAQQPHDCSAWPRVPHLLLLGRSQLARLHRSSASAVVVGVTVVLLLCWPRVGPGQSLTPFYFLTSPPSTLIC